MSREKLALRSAHGGLWARLITKILAYWLGFYWFVIIMSAVVPDLTTWGAVSFISFLLVCWVTFGLLKDHPRTWPKEVEFDFVEKRITLLDGYGKRFNDDILDAPERTIAFSEIDHLHGESYESVILSSVYRLSVVRGGEQIKLVALKSPNDYTFLIGQFQQAGIRIS